MEINEKRDLWSSDFNASGLNSETIEENGIEVFEGTHEELAGILNVDPVFTKTLCEDHAVVIFPYQRIEKSQQDICRAKIIPPFEFNNGKLLKYIQPKGVPTRPYIINRVWNVRKDTTVDLFIVEGEKKALLLNQEGFPAIALPGVYNFRNSSEKDTETIDLSTDLQAFVWNERNVYIAFDSDFRTNKQVRLAMFELGLRLEKHGATVKFTIWHPVDGKGIDDYLLSKSTESAINNENSHQVSIESLKSTSLSLNDKSFGIYKDEIVLGQVKAASGLADLEIASKRFSPVVGVSPGTLFSEMKSKFKVIKRSQQNASRLVETRYVVEDGCLAVVTPDGLKKIADCCAKITANLFNENESLLYLVEVTTKDNLTRSMKISVEEFSDQRILKTKLEAMMGHNMSVAANMSSHLCPAIKSNSADNVQNLLLFNSTGFKTVNGKRIFLIPGMEPDGVVVELPGSKLCYQISKSADLEKALNALDNLLRAHPQTITTIALAFVMQPPLAELAQWREERYCFFVRGLTGSLKSAFAQVLMCIWGPDFKNDNSIFKWGEGSTNNGLMGSSVHICDMPILIDNFKPNTGGGPKAFIGLIHNILEGGEKVRLDKNSELRKSRPISAWPFSTGEDVPHSDASTLARLLVVHVPKIEGFNEELKVAQDLSEHLNAIGALWLQILEHWMEDNEAVVAMRKLSADFIRKWSEKLHNQYPKMVNKMRIATNLATNEFTWHLLCKIPELQPILSKYSNAHAEGLEEIAKNLAASTRGSTEAEQFLEALREALQTGQLNINPKRGCKSKDQHGNITSYHGWWENGNLCISPETVSTLLARLVGLNNNSVSKQTLHEQLYALGAIAETGKDTPTKVFTVDGEAYRVLVLKGAVVTHENPDPEASNDRVPF